jgi:LytS/YehU family sensor histidine kinase
VSNSIPTDIPETGRVHKGIGLENLRRRLELLYPDRHTFTAEKDQAVFSAALTLQYT